MKAVILAAGKSTRTHPLTVDRPKALLKVANITLIDHALSQLQGIIDEAIIVVGYHAEQVKEHLGSSFRKIKITYAAQKEQLGTGNALLAAEGKVKGRFILLMGDDLYSKADIRKCASCDYAILAKEVGDVSSFGAVIAENGVLAGISEKDRNAATNLANTGLYVLDDRIFGIAGKLRKSGRGEYELTDAVAEFAKLEKVPVVRASSWMPITYPWSLLEANEKLLLGIGNDLSAATVEKNVVIKGKVSVGRNSLIRSGAYIEGPVIIGDNCDIGPNCYIRPFTSIGNGCRVGNAVEIKDSIVMDGSHIGHLSYVGDSVIGSNVNFGAGTIIANLRHDNAEVKSMVNGKLEGSGRRKLGAIIGDGAKLGIHTTIYPGRKVWPCCTTRPGEVVKDDVR
jgi:UDP-N-acetylglucosamine diphosphorylase / glucose-1-phosphate thymidylyltransferase / UDP-N-acetylgalactosamine diphosphorylase / glucosamine-1-phosphate N-acetyltransferase / galactosamine-1-phosphate N-acetyltransferase